MIAITDVTLRDGSHAMVHQFTVDQVSATVTALEAAGVRSIKVGHGDGLGGSSFQLRLLWSRRDGANRRRGAGGRSGRNRMSTAAGSGTAERIDAVFDAGVRMLRVATHSTEADIAVQHIAAARARGMDTVGFLMLSHMTAPDELARRPW